MNTLFLTGFPAAFLAGQWLPRCGNVLLQSLFVLCLAFGGLELARRASASVRHLIAITAQFALLLLPLAAVVLPNRARVPAPQDFRAAIPHDLPAPAAAYAARIDGSAKTVAGQRDSGFAAALPSAAAGMTGSRQAQIGGREGAMFSGGWRGAAQCAFAVWLAGFGWMLARLGVGAARLRHFAQACRTVSDPALLSRLNRLQAEAGLLRRVRVVQPTISDNAPAVTVTPAVPMTWGALHPFLLLPAEAAQWDAGRLRAVALHELAHIERYDWLTQTLGQTICAIYWYNPLVWRLHRQAQMEAEHACDDAVLRRGVRGSEYAAHLLEMARGLQTRRDLFPAGVSMARASQVTPRVQAVLCPRCRRGEVRRPLLSACFAAAGLVFFAANRLRPLAPQIRPARTPLPARDAAFPTPHAQAFSRPTPAQIAAAPGLPAYRHMFSCGLTLELAAVADVRGNRAQWWRPDGGPLPDALKAPYATNGLNTWTTQDNGRAFLFRASGTLQREYSAATQTTPAKMWLGVQHSVSDTTPYEPYPAHSLWCGFPADTRRCSIRYGVAAGAWKTVAVVRMPSHARHIKPDPKVLQNDIDIYLADESSLGYEDQAGKYHWINFLSHGKLSSNVARRIMAVDGNGALLPLQHRATGADDEYYGLNFHDADSNANCDHVREFRLQTRPYEWTEFANIRLQPGSQAF